MDDAMELVEYAKSSRIICFRPVSEKYSIKIDMTKLACKHFWNVHIIEFC